MSGYHSGEDPEASGPLDTRNHSFTGNPPISSTGNTSPTHESSVVGVTAQIGLRLNELKGLQSEHERIAKGQFDSNGEMHVAPEPLGVAYGKKIGVGGFGAVYEGQWAGKQVAVKVRAHMHCLRWWLCGEALCGCRSGGGSSEQRLNACGSPAQRASIAAT